MSSNNSSSKALHVIEPKKCIIDDVEILGFESEEQLNFYTIWHEALVDKRRERHAGTERERQIIRNEIARKTRQLIGSVKDNNLKRPNTSSNSRSSKSHKSSSRPNVPVVLQESRTLDETTTPTSPRKTATSSALAASRKAVAAAVAFRPSRIIHPTFQASHTASSSRPQYGTLNLPNGLALHNSTQHGYNTMPNGKQLMKYKLTKLYNKYRGRQARRNFVNDKQRNAKIEEEIGKSYLNSWLAYRALQALRLPDSNNNLLNTTTNNNSKILTHMVQTNSPGKKGKTSSKKQQQTEACSQSNQTSQKAPVHLVYIDPGNIITYSNRINPQQIAEYRQKSHLPSSATSKKSSAASYDAYEIMEVLANTNKTNVTITRNANRPNQSTASIYSHSVNSNTPGIVSTQLHLQARSYLDSLRKFYAEERQRLEEDQKSV